MNDTNQDPNPYAVGVPTKTLNPKLLSAEQVRKEHLSHEASVKSIGLLYILGGVFGLFLFLGYVGIGIGLLSAPDAPGEMPSATMGLFLIVFGVFVLILSVVQLFAAVGLRKLAFWSKIPCSIIAGIGLLVIPVGTLISAYVLYLIWSEKGKMVFSPEYKDVIQQTPHIKYKTSIFVWIFVGILMALILFGITAAVFGA